MNWVVWSFVFLWIERQAVLTNSACVPPTIQSKLEQVLQRIIDLESSSRPSCSSSSLSMMCVQQSDKSGGRRALAQVQQPNGSSRSSRHPVAAAANIGVCDIVVYKWDYANVPLRKQQAIWRVQTADQLWRMKVTLETRGSSFPQCIIFITHWRHSRLAWGFLQSTKSISNHRLIFVHDANNTIRDEQLLPILPGSDIDDPTAGKMTEPRAAIVIQIGHTHRHPVEQNAKVTLGSICPHCQERRRFQTFEVALNSSELEDVYHTLSTSCCHPLENKTLRVSFIGASPFIVYSEPVSGVDLRIIEILAGKFKFNYTLHAEVSHGRRDASGRWSGMVESVRTGRSDLGIGFPTISMDRAQVVHFTAMIYPLEYGYASPIPKPKDPVYRVVSVFENSVWTWLIVAFLAVSLTFIGIHYTSASSNVLNKHGAKSEPSSRMTSSYLKHERRSSDFFMVPLAILTSQVAQIPFPRGASSCLTFLNWLLMATLISNFYRSTLLAHLVSVEFNNPIQVTQDLLNNDKPMYVPSGSQLVSLFENSPNPAHVRVIAKTKENNHLYTLENGQLPLWVQDDIQDKSGAFVTFRQADLTNYVFSREIVYMARTGFMVHSEHTWRSDFDPILEVIKSSGLLSKFVQEFAVQSPREDITGHNELVQPLAFEHVQGVFSVWIAGLVLAMVVFVLEKFGRLDY